MALNRLTGKPFQPPPSAIAGIQQPQSVVQLPESVKANLPTPIVTPETTTMSTNGTENRTIAQPETTTNQRRNTYVAPQATVRAPETRMSGPKRNNLFADVWGANAALYTGMYGNRSGFYNPV